MGLITRQKSPEHCSAFFSCVHLKWSYCLNASVSQFLSDELGKRIQVFRCKSDSERCHRERTSLKMDCLDKSLCLTCSRLNGLAYLAFVGHH